MVIIDLRFDDDKGKIFKRRQELRERNIRISDNLTRKQREIMKTCKKEGKIGYYYKERFMIRPRKMGDDNKSMN